MLADSQIYKTVQRSNTTTLLLSLIALAIVGVLSYLYIVPYWMQKLGEPRVLTVEELLALDGSTPLYNVRIEGERMRDTYYYEETRDEKSNSRVSIDAYFGALRVADDTWILVRQTGEIDTHEENYTGTVMAISGGSVAEQVYGISADDLNIDYLPGIMLDTTDSDGIWYFGTGGLGVLALGGLWGLATYASRSGNPAKHPTLRRLSRFGEVEQVVDSIEKDLSTSEDRVGKLRLSKNWLVQSGGTNFEAMPYHSVAWVYKMIRHGRYGRTYFAHIYDRTGVGIVIQDKEGNVDMMLQAVASRAPWAIHGYSSDVKRAWSKNRAGLIAEVDARQVQYKQQQF